jgi:hypothetical protein
MIFILKKVLSLTNKPLKKNKMKKEIKAIEIAKGKLLRESHGGMFKLYRYKRVEYILHVIDGTIMTIKDDERMAKRLDLKPVF